MLNKLRLYEGPSGPELKGNNGDVLTYSTAADAWIASPASGGGGVSQVSTTRWVDKNAEAATPNGSVGAPFASVADAMAALEDAWAIYGDGPTYCLNLFPGNYGAEPVGWAHATPFAITGYAGVGGVQLPEPVVGVVTVTGGAAVAVAFCDVAELQCEDSNVELTNGNLLGNPSVFRTLSARNFIFNTAISYEFTGQFQGCDFAANVNQTGVASPTTLTSCSLQAGVTFTGNVASTITWDEYTAKQATAAALTLVGFTPNGRIPTAFATLDLSGADFGEIAPGETATANGSSPADALPDGRALVSFPGTPVATGLVIVGAAINGTADVRITLFNASADPIAPSDFHATCWYETTGFPY